MKQKLNNWTTYNGTYEKKWYDVKTKQLNLFKQCYPNGGDFYTNKNNMISGENTLEIRLSLYNPLGDLQ